MPTQLPLIVYGKTQQPREETKKKEVTGQMVPGQRQPSAREPVLSEVEVMADAELLIEIKEIFAASGQTYGSPRIHIELREQGIRCGRKRVERLMGENGLKVPQKRKKRVVFSCGYGPFFTLYGKFLCYFEK